MRIVISDSSALIDLAKVRLIENLLRDLRHGQPIVHELDQADALYWIERVLALVNYLSRRSAATGV